VKVQNLGFSALVFWGCIHCYHLHSAPIIQLSFIVNIVFLVCIAALHSHPAGAISLLLQLLKIQIFLLPTMLCIILFSSSISYHLDFVLNINMILATFLHWCRYWTQIKSNQIYCSDDLVRMSFPLLASLGVRLEKENLYNNLLAAVKEKNLGRVYLCICVFVYLCIFMWDPCKHWFWHPRNISFSKI